MARVGGARFRCAVLHVRRIDFPGSARRAIDRLCLPATPPLGADKPGTARSLHAVPRLFAVAARALLVRRVWLVRLPRLPVLAETLAARGRFARAGAVAARAAADFGRAARRL